MKKIKRYIYLLTVALAVTCSSAPAYADPAESRDVSHLQTSSQPQVRVLGGRIEITISGDDDCQVTIYALTGQIVKSLMAAPGQTSVELPKGYYIVKCDNVSCRVIVR